MIRFWSWGDMAKRITEVTAWTGNVEPNIKTCIVWREMRFSEVRDFMLDEIGQGR